jgi:hypothetical protein
MVAAIGMAVCCVSLSTAVAAASRKAAGTFSVFGGEAPVEFSAKASNGYSIEVEGSGRRVTLSAGGPSGTAVYIAPGRVAHGRIVTGFGKLGRIDVKFKPSRRRKVEAPPRGCKGKPHVTRWGVFVGTIRFAGERGFTRLNVSRARGRTHFAPGWKCKRGRGGSGKNGSGSQPSVPGESSEDALVLEIVNRQTGVEAGAFTFRPPGKKSDTAFIAGLEERRGRMQVVRFAFKSAGERTFSFDESLSGATIAPPSPFAGTATFQRNPGGEPTLSGSLSVALPGTARIPLVGAGYRARLYRLSEDSVALPAG